MRRSYLAVLIAAVLIAASGLFGAAQASVSAPALYHAPAIVIASSPAGWSSPNWSGYAGTTSPGDATQIEAYWVVPKVKATKGNSYSSTWIGIDGFDNKDLIQTGTEQDWVGGKAHYDAWWEILPAAETRISMGVVPGDVMEAIVEQVSGTTWGIGIENTTTGKVFTTKRTYKGPAESAEFIQEATEINGNIATLAHYGETKFSKDEVDGSLVTLTKGERGVMIQHGVQVSTPSLPSSAHPNAFNVAYGSATPAPPS